MSETSVTGVTMKLFPCLAAVAAAFAAIPASAQPAAAPRAPALPSAPPAYDTDDAWLCLPGRAGDPCAEPLPTVSLDPAGYGPVTRSRPADAPTADCFYVYPTLSRDPSLNSDLDAGTEERQAARDQFARFHEVCRTFAPIYRQVTLLSFAPGVTQAQVGQAFDTAYGDVRSAWRQFLSQRSEGRPFILIGHSQGSIHLERLIKEEIEGKPIAARMVSAILPGWNIEVPVGGHVGGSFASTPLCMAPGQTGCVVTWVSFRHDVPPPGGALFGRAARPGMTVGCTNPARLAGSESGPRPIFPQAIEFGRAIDWSRVGTPPARFIRTPGLVSAACVHDGAVGYLAITVNGDPGDARTDDIPGDLFSNGQRQSGWGLHLVDMALVMDDLIEVTRAQIAAHASVAERVPHAEAR